MRKAYRREITPEEIFHYIYAVLYAPGYRERYGEFLRTDFPRIPFPKDWEIMEALAGLGRRLVELHLLRSAELDPPSARFEGKGPNRVEKGKLGLRYEPETQRVFINQTQYFAPVPLEVWEYPIGGYQVCAKWLKDRQDRQLSLDEIRTYCQILTALGKTIAIQEEIDDLYSRVEEAILEVGNTG